MPKISFSRRSFLKSSMALSATALVSPKSAFSQSVAYYVPLDAVLHTRTRMAFPDSVAIYGIAVLPLVPFWDMVEASGNTMGCRLRRRFRPSMTGCIQVGVNRD